MNRSRLCLAFSILALCCTALAILVQGVMPWDLVWDGAALRLTGGDSGWNPLLDERLPRLLVLGLSGASLAVAGSVMQSLFQNPLASPSVLGVSGGGSFCMLLVLVGGVHFERPMLLPLAALGGSLCSLFLVYFLAYRQGRLYPSSLILTGIAISSLLMALHSLILYFYREEWQLIQTISEWEAGSTLDRGWRHVHMQAPLAIIGLWICLHYRREIQILVLGEEEAKMLGVEVERVRWHLFLAVALLVGGTLAAIGPLAFFGLLVPHLVRLLLRGNEQQLIVLSALSGAAALSLLDLFLRVTGLFMLSLGNLSAILGGLLFLFLLLRSQKQEAQWF